MVLQDKTFLQGNQSCAYPNNRPLGKVYTTRLANLNADPNYAYVKKTLTWFIQSNSTMVI
jgi:hypothetical protein